MVFAFWGELVDSFRLFFFSSGGECRQYRSYEKRCTIFSLCLIIQVSIVPSAFGIKSNPQVQASTTSTTIALGLLSLSLSFTLRISTT